MMSSFDLFGFLSDDPIPGRETTVAPPDAGEWPAGKRPNWTGYVWIYLDWPPPPAPEPVSFDRVVSRLQFLDRFTDAELAGILAAAAASPAIQVWTKKLELAGEVDLDSPRTIAGVNALETAGLIGAGRGAAILA